MPNPPLADAIRSGAHAFLDELSLSPQGCAKRRQHDLSDHYQPDAAPGLV